MGSDNARMNETTATAPDSNGADTRPGVLVTVLKIKLHTYDAQKLYKGRTETKKRAGILGLEGFARICTIVSRNPRARELLEEKLKNAETRLEALQRQNDEAKERNRLEVTDHASTEPVVIEIRSSTPVAGRGAQMLKTYDDLIRDILLLYRVGVYDAGEYDQRQRMATRYVRGAYAAAFDALGLANDEKTDSPAEVTTTENKET